MSIRYYWRDNPCEHCDRFTEVFVCRSRMGWKQYPHKLIAKDHPEWGFDPWSPFGFEVMTLEDWLEVFTKRKGELWDEYGTRVLDPVAWMIQVMESIHRPSYTFSDRYA